MTPARIKTIRRSLGLTQRKLAEQLGVHVVTVKKWETGVYKIGRSAAVRLWLLEQNRSKGNGNGVALAGEELVTALSRRDAGGVIGVARQGPTAAGSVTVKGKKRRFTRFDCPGREPGVLFAFNDLSAEEFETFRLALLEQVLAATGAARAETAPSVDKGPRSRRQRRPKSWVSADWLGRQSGR